MTTVYDTLIVAGDLRPMTQQVSIALGTGNIAAVQIDQYLAAKDQTSHDGREQG